MASDLDIAQVVYNLYWDTTKLDQIIDPDGVCVGIKHFIEATVICFRGSTTFLDWVRDFEDFAQMVDDPDLGGVHPGFIEGMHDVLGQVRLDPKKPTIITGHSLGAARAWVYAALVAEHDTVTAGDRIVVFGSPLPGAQKIKELVTPYAKTAYKNRHDPVCDVPFTIPYLDPYVFPWTNTRLNASPPPNDPWGVFADHHFDLYMQAISAGSPGNGLHQASVG